MENKMEKIIEVIKGRFEEVALSDLTIHPIAEKIYGRRNIRQLADDVEAYGAMIFNIKVNRKFQILSGGRRKLALEMLGVTSAFVEIMDDLPEADEELFVVESNNQREKTEREKYLEIKILEREMPKRPGRRTDLTGDKPINMREEIAKRLEIKPSEVNDLLTVGDYSEEMLDSIDGVNEKLTPLAAKIRKMRKQGSDKFTAVVNIPLLTKSCPTCDTHPTPRIEIIGRTLQFKSQPETE